MQFIRVPNDNDEKKKLLNKMRNLMSSWNLACNQTFIHTLFDWQNG